MMYMCGKYKYGEKKLELKGREEEIEGAKVMIYEARGMWGTKERKKRERKKKKKKEESRRGKKDSNVRDVGAERRTKKIMK
jgi:hypothetical protein